MNVRELIEALQKLPGELTVVHLGREDCYWEVEQLEREEVEADPNGVWSTWQDHDGNGRSGSVVVLS
jgi:surface antigen